MDGNGSVLSNAPPLPNNDSGLAQMDFDGHNIQGNGTPPGTRNKSNKSNNNNQNQNQVLSNSLQTLESRGFSIGLSAKTMQQQLKQQTTVIANQNGNAQLHSSANSEGSASKKRKNDDRAAAPTNEANRLSNNRFALLAPLEIQQLNNDNEQDEIVSSSAANINRTTMPRTRSPADLITTNAQNKNVTSPTVTASNRFCPPIILHNVDIKALANQFKLNFPDIAIKIINKSKYISKLYIQDYDAYLYILASLKEKGISTHTFTPAQNKQLSLIVRGLHHLKTH